MPYGRRNALEFSTHHDVQKWYDEKYLEMGDGWYTPDCDIDAHLNAMGYPEDATDTKLLDLGCGAGFLLRRASMHGGEVLGIELSPVVQKMAQERAPLSHIILAPMENLPFEDDFFDFVISLGSIEHALDIPMAVEEAHRVLKPGGKFLLYVPNEDWIHEDQPLETIMSSGEWSELLIKSGFDLIDTVRFTDNNRVICTK